MKVSRSVPILRGRWEPRANPSALGLTCSASRAPAPADGTYQSGGGAVLIDVERSGSGVLAVYLMRLS